MQRLVHRLPFVLPMLVLLGSSPLARANAQAAPAAPAPTLPAANPADVASVDAIIAALYDVISGAAGQARNWDRMRSLFIPGARLIPSNQRPDGTVTHRVLTVEDYIAQSGPQLERNGFFEREIGRKTDAFGNVTHVFSAYDSKRTAQDEKPFARGINSIQLLNDGKRWYVVTIFWDSERPNNQIPEKYLAK
jgi:hypothetical protein